MKNLTLKQAYLEAKKQSWNLPRFVVMSDSAKSLRDKAFFVRDGCYSDLQCERVNSWDTYRGWRENLKFTF